MASDSEASITVPRFKDVSSLDGKWKKYYTVYMVRFQAGELDQVVFKRYKQFKKLDLKCRGRFAPDYISKLPKLPRKSGLFSSTDTDEKKNDRRRGLQAYLQAVAGERELVDLIADFVDVAVIPQKEGQPPPRKGAQKWGSLWVFEKPFMVYGPGTSNGNVHIGDLLTSTSGGTLILSGTERDSDDDADAGELSYRAANLTNDGTGYDGPNDQTAKVERDTWEFWNFEPKLARSGSCLGARFRIVGKGSGSSLHLLGSVDFMSSSNSYPNNSTLRNVDEQFPAKPPRSVTFYHSVLVFGSKASQKRDSKPLPQSSSLAFLSSSSSSQTSSVAPSGIPVGTLVVSAPRASPSDSGIPVAILTGTLATPGTAPPAADKGLQARPGLVITDNYFDNPRPIDTKIGSSSSPSLSSSSSSNSSSSSSSISSLSSNSSNSSSSSSMSISPSSQPPSKPLSDSNNTADSASVQKKNQNKESEEEELVSSVAPLKLGNSSSMITSKSAGRIGSGQMITAPGVEVKKRRSIPASQSMLDIGHQPRYDLYHR